MSLTSTIPFESRSAAPTVAQKFPCVPQLPKPVCPEAVLARKNAPQITKKDCIALWLDPANIMTGMAHGLRLVI
jgi:hypothetical protein